MRPFQHFLLAVVPVTLYTWIRYRRLPTGYTVLLVLVATLLPDAIDKPLAWTVGVLPSGRMVAHSIVLSGPVLALAYRRGARAGRGRDVALFSVAYLSHLAGDFYPILRQGTDYYFFPNLVWPLLPVNPDRAPSFAAHAPSDGATVAVSATVFLAAIAYVAADIVPKRRA